MKPMTFEEWDRITDEPMAPRELFDKARIGMIPEDGAIRIPPEKEWPENASGISAIYVSANGLKPGCAIWESYKGEDEEALIQFIPRSKPAWVPKVGEAVFFCDSEGLYKISKIEITDLGKTVYILSNNYCALVSDLKPGDVAYIGKPWSEIPEGK